MNAAETVGFFYVSQPWAAHGPDRAYGCRGAPLFFLPLEQKQQVKVARRGTEAISRRRSQDVSGAKPDLKESFIWGMELVATSPIPPLQTASADQSVARTPAEMRPTLNEFFVAANQCGRVLFRAFAAGLGLDLDHFTTQFDRPITRGALIFYPPQQPDLGDDQFGVAPHTDYGCLTLLYQDPIGGLQVQGRNGEWVVAHPSKARWSSTSAT
jgi:isopenicillin N synthase-like dioxygenase